MESRLDRRRIDAAREYQKMLPKLLACSYELLLEERISRDKYDDRAKISILDLGCGRCFEAESVVNFFGKGKQINLVGIDKSTDEIEDAIKFNSGLLARDNTTIEFRVGNFANLGNSTRGQFEVVIIRHPNIRANLEDWNKCIQNLKEVMASKGVIVVTTYLEREKIEFRQQLEQAGFCLAVDEPNRFALAREDEMTDPFCKYDNFVLIATKFPDYSLVKRTLAAEYSSRN